MSKVVVVTGAGSGIGRSISYRLAADGHAIAAVDIDPSGLVATVEQIVATGGTAQAFPADIVPPGAFEQITADVEAGLGPVAVLCNVAGIGVAAPLLTTSTEDWDRVFAVNVRGLVQATRAAAPHLRSSRGSIVNVASIVGLRPGPQPLAYAASKAAVVSLNRTLSRVLAPEVRVNAVAPGWIAGEWMERTLGDNYERLMERRAKFTPMQRNVTLEDVAESIWSLATSHPFVTGEVVVIDGGFTATT